MVLIRFLIDENETGPEGNIIIHLNSPVDPAIKTEGYKLHIKNDRIFLNANTPTGVFYGFQTIWQLLTSNEGNTIPAVEIVDYPRFAWRGLHLDVSRHFMPAEFIYKYIDYIAMYKMNVFHWHLVDGIKGSVNHAGGNWKGYNGNELVATIDSGKKLNVSSVEVGFLQNVGAWIFYPTELLVETSNDGINFKRLGRTKNKISTEEQGRIIQTLKVNKNANAHYLRITAKNLGTCPKWHAGEGKPAWLFVDEIIVE